MAVQRTIILHAGAFGAFVKAFHPSLVSLGLALVALMACESNGSAPTLDSAEVARGRAIYAQSCQQCHGEAATGTGRVAEAPPHSNAGHTWHHADGQIVDIVLGRFQYPGRVMPTFAGQLTEAQVMDVLAYLKSNWGEEQRAFQSQVSQQWEAGK
ncbi:MAG: cytochrome c [Chloroflexi bacterium]|nr:cytochrome c [Chloroflexota bacterium]